MAKDLEAPKPFVPSGFVDGDKLDAGGIEQMRFGLAGSGPLAKAVLDSNAVGTMRQLIGGGATPTTTIPVGTISPYAGTSAPANWLLCDGAAVSRSTYAALFDVTGTAYGAGDGSTTFNVPDLRGRVVAGKDNMGGTPQNRLTTAGSGVDGVTLGANGGTQTHALTEAQLASHTHTPQLTAYDVSVGAGGYYSGAGQALLAARQGWANAPPPTYNGNVSLFQANSNTGSGTAHQNTQPTIITTYIIKAVADVTNTFGVALSGVAGGMLSGTYPNPSVASIAGLTAGGGLTGTYPNPTVASIAGLTAGGELTGTYPNPTIAPIIATNLKVQNAAPTITISESTGTALATLELTDRNNPVSSEGTQLRYDSSTGHSYLRSTYSAGNLYLGAGSSSASQVSIGPSGRVTLPYQPAFYGFKSGGAGTGVWAADTAITNRGNHYNTGTGLMTCPVAGVYCLYMTGLGWTNPGYGYLYIQKNGVNQNGFSHWNMNTPQGSTWCNPSILGVVDCNQYDTINIFVLVAGGNPGVYNTYHNNLSIYFLG